MTSEHRKTSAVEGALWRAAKEALDKFNAKYMEAQRLFRGNGPEDPDAGEKLLTEFAFLKGGTAPSFQGPFADWIVEAFNLSDIDHPEAFRPSGRRIVEVMDGKAEITDFMDALDRYRDAIENVVRKVAPEHFSYQGFKIWNPERLGEQVCRRLLEGVDYLVALFKKRGVYPLLHTGVRQVELVPTPTMVKLHATALGLYYESSQTIVLSTKAIGHGTGRFMDWIHEVFLHEFGHYVHLNYLPREAREAWDSGWAEVRDQEKAFTQAFKTITSVERAKFFDALAFTKFDPSKAARRLNPVERVKFGVWLRSPLIGDPLVTPKQLRWTSSGKRLADFFTDRQSFMKKEYDWMEPGSKEYETQLQRTERQLQDKLGLLWDGQMSIPPATVEELSKADPTIRQSIQEALTKLEIVSDYGQTNEKEDFAETFVAFMGAPSKLTPTAKFRMQRTLSLANFYNKPVMRLAENASLAEHIVNRYLYDRRQ